MGMFVYKVFKGLKLREDAVVKEYGWVDPKTGQRPEKVLYVSKGCDERPNLTKELRYGAYEYKHHFEFSLELGCQGRDWPNVLGALVGFDRRNPDAYPTDGPFVEILDPLYSMTTHGPKTSAKLVADFDAWDERAQRFSDEEFYLTYWWLRTCFSHGKQNGAVKLYWLMR